MWSFLFLTDDVIHLRSSAADTLAVCGCQGEDIVKQSGQHAGLL